jgi:hypothetical protein
MFPFNWLIFVARAVTIIARADDARARVKAHALRVATGFSDAVGTRNADAFHGMTAWEDFHAAIHELRALALQVEFMIALEERPEKDN